MPVIIRNKTNAIEVDLSFNLKVTVSKGAFDIIYEDIGDNVPYIYLIIRDSMMINKNIKLDWRDVTSPDAVFTSAEDLRDTLLTWNIPVNSISSSALPDGAASEDKQDALYSLTETLQELNARLVPLAGVVQSGGSFLRVVQTAVPSTAVTGPATSAQVVAALLTQTNAIEKYSGNAVHSNINNVIPG